MRSCDLIPPQRCPPPLLLTGASVPLTDLLAATEGDVVLLGTGADRQVELMVAGVSVARGRPGVKSGMMAVKISSTDAS